MLTRHIDCVGGGGDDNHPAVSLSLPVTDEILLVEETAIGAEEGILDERALQATSADVERLKKTTSSSQKINFHGISVCGEPDTRPQDQHNSRPRLDRRRGTRSLVPIWGEIVG